MGDKKCRSVGQCILGLKARLVSVSPRQGGQPAGLRRELELTGIGAGGEVPGCPHWPGGGSPTWKEENGHSRARKDRVSWPGRTTVAISLRVTLGKLLLSLKSEFTPAPSEEVRADL